MSDRGITEINLNDTTMEMRFRPYELGKLDKAFRKNGIERTVTGLIQHVAKESQKALADNDDEANIEIGFDEIALIIMTGVGHLYARRVGKSARLNAEMVGDWLADCGVGSNDSFDVVMSKCIEGIMKGLPGASSTLAQAEQAKIEASKDKGKGVDENPLESTPDPTPSDSTGKKSR